MTPVPVRLAVATGTRRIEAAAVTPDGTVVATAELDPTGSPAADVEAALARLLAVREVDPGATLAVVAAGRWAAAALRPPYDLVPVASIRLATPARSAFPPLHGWPPALRTAVSAGEAIVTGGCGVDGSAAAPLDEAGLRAALTRADPAAVAITATFAGVSAADEHAAERTVEATLPGTPVVLSHEFGALGLLERENSAVLDAALTGVGRRLVDAIATALERLRIDAPAYLVRNDGTLIAAAEAARFPLLTYAGGDAAWLRGAAALAGVGDALVCRAEPDGIAVGAVQGARPRESSGRRLIAGVPTSVELPDVAAVRHGPGASRHRAEPARTLARLGGREAPRPLVVVGGAARMLAGELPADSEAQCPRLAEFAAAVGAALAPVSATVEVVLPRYLPAERRYAELAARATDLALYNGADPGGIAVVEFAEVPLPYLPESPVRCRARAEGPPQGRLRGVS
ncbi:hypothetical protein ACU61A_33500 [Pseudonocardia sichuanensis]